MEQALQGSGHGTELARVQELDNALTYDLIFRTSCVDPGVGVDDPCGFLPTQDIL